MHDAIEKGKEFIRVAQEKKERDVNAYCRLVDFDIEDRVWVSTKL
jgi:hypothetical protein